MRSESDHEMSPSRWLARAREQSQALAEARARETRALISPTQVRARAGAGHSLVWVAMATLAMLLVGSGAWALVARMERAHRSTPPLAPLVPRPQLRAIVNSSSPPAVLPPPPVAKRKHRPPAPAPTTTPPRQTHALEQGDGEIIIVPPEHEAEPPLFSPAEWKRAHQPPDPPR